MAMTKKEIAAFAELQKDLVVARAWRRTEPVMRDLSVPRNGEISGWIFNLHSKRVEPAWSGFTCHGRGYATRKEARGSASQNGIALFSSKLLALRAMRYEAEEEAVRMLAEIDAQIADELLLTAIAAGAKP